MSRAFTLCVAVLALTAAGLALTGCKSGDKGPISYDLGTLSAKVPAPMAQVVDAAGSALNDYGVTVQNLDKQADSTVFKGQTQSGGPVTLRIQKLDDSQSEVKIATDLLGNYEESLGLMKKLYDKLGLKMP